MEYHERNITGCYPILAGHIQSLGAFKPLAQAKICVGLELWITLILCAFYFSLLGDCHWNQTRWQTSWGGPGVFPMCVTLYICQWTAAFKNSQLGLLYLYAVIRFIPLLWDGYLRQYRIKTRWLMYYIFSPSWSQRNMIKPCILWKSDWCKK